MNKLLLSISCFLLFSVALFSQDSPSDGSGSGVAVSPSSLRFNIKPGTSATKEVKLTNDTKTTYKFQVGFSDFIMDANGKPIGIKPKSSKYALSKWITVSPSYFELKPGEVKKLTVTVDVPNNDSANIAAWTILMIDQVTERQTKLETTPSNSNTLAMGIVPSFGFGVYIYQNPPNVKTNNVEIMDFKYVFEKQKHYMVMKVKNAGDGIGFCISYIELTNLKTGKQEKLGKKQYTILPGFERSFQYPLPDSVAIGKYSALGVMDFGSKTEIETAELEFEIK